MPRTCSNGSGARWALGIVVSLRFEDAMTAADGTTTRMQGPTTFLWRLDDGVWRIVYVEADHYPVPAP